MTQDNAEPSAASAGSVGEPVAWAVKRIGGGWVCILQNEGQAETSRKSHDRTDATWVHEVVPLYRNPILTELERLAIWDAVNAYSENDDDPECSRIARALSGLLERLK